MDDNSTRCFRYQWIQHIDGIVLMIDGGTFSIPYDSYGLLDNISSLSKDDGPGVDSQMIINSRYGAKIALGQVQSVVSGPPKIVLSFFDAWGETLGIYFLPVDTYNTMILNGYIALGQKTKI